MIKYITYLAFGGLTLSGCFFCCATPESTATASSEKPLASTPVLSPIPTGYLLDVASKKTNPEELITIFYFDSDEIVIDDVTKKLLNPVANYLKSNPAQRIFIVGNTDVYGTHQYNLALGQKRANAIMAYLASVGVPPSQMTAISRGKESPISTADNEQAQSLNRRVEILFER